MVTFQMPKILTNNKQKVLFSKYKTIGLGDASIIFFLYVPTPSKTHAPDRHIAGGVVIARILESLLSIYVGDGHVPNAKDFDKQ